MRPPCALDTPAAVTHVACEFIHDVGARQRLLRTTTEVPLALLDHTTIFEYRADMTGELVRIWIMWIDHVADLIGEREHIGVAGRRVGKKSSPTPPRTKAVARMNGVANLAA